MRREVGITWVKIEKWRLCTVVYARVRSMHGVCFLWSSEAPSSWLLISLLSPPLRTRLGGMQNLTFQSSNTLLQVSIENQLTSAGYDSRPDLNLHPICTILPRKRFLQSAIKQREWGGRQNDRRSPTFCTLANPSVTRSVGTTLEKT